MGPLNRKLLRDLWRLRGQVLAIALVVASGVAVLVMSLTALEALSATASAYYDRFRFADVFAGVKRAPERLARKIAAVDGVQTVETRIVQFALLDIDGFEEPVVGQLVSIPEGRQPHLNRLALRSGRLVEPGRPDEIVLSEPFADAHGFKVGDRVEALINAAKRPLEIVGTALSPEFAYSIGPGALIPDDQRFGIIWIGREALAAAYDLDGAFNDVTLSLLAHASPEAVIDSLDPLLERYGGTGAIARKDQISNWFVNNELDQLRTMATILPTIFIAVAAFLTNMVLGRLIATERAEIGLFKAFGYSNLEVGWLYVKMVLAMTMVGIAIGWIAGAWLGRFNTQLYATLYHFPFLLYRPSPFAFVIAALVSLAAALFGALGAVRGAVRLPPAEAMRPPAPPVYHRTRLSEGRLAHWLDQPTRIVLRQIIRWPIRSALTVVGIAMSVAVLIMANQWLDSIDHMIRVYYEEAQHQNVTVGLVESESERVLRDFEHLPGAFVAEPMRTVGARFRSGMEVHLGALHGAPREATLAPVYDVKGEVVDLPQNGMAMSTKLAEKLGVGLGDSVRVEILEGRRLHLDIMVARLFETYIGMPAYMDLDAFNRLLREPFAVDYVHVLADERAMPAFFAELKELPGVASIVVRRAAIDLMHKTVGENMTIFISFFSVFAALLAFGVVYSSARIGLSESGRELATLRVLGFSRWEISYVLLGQLGFLLALALPLGCLIGWGLVWLVISAFETELYRIPLVIERSTFGMAVLIVLISALVSAALIRRRLDRLDLIAVLKTRE
ncbi:MAG: ABC transporter permease [Alphaproteobacteria bacterium]|nr:ABC transporter permease [Alphaproteobacteria bacterium]